MEKIYATHDKSLLKRIAHLQEDLEEAIYTEMQVTFERKYGYLPQEILDGTVCINRPDDFSESSGNESQGQKRKIGSDSAQPGSAG